MTLELFGFVKRPASASSAADPLATDGVEASSSGIPTSALRRGDPLAPPSKRRRFNMNWTEGREWLTHDTDADVMFCEWCRRFDRNDHRNQFVKVCQCACISLAGPRPFLRETMHVCQSCYQLCFAYILISFIVTSVLPKECLATKNLQWRLSLEVSGHHWRPGVCS